MLVKLAKILPVDLKAMSPENDDRAVAELLEALGDPLFEGYDLIATEMREMATSHPGAVQAILRLYRAYGEAREAAATLAAKLSDGDALDGMPQARFPTEEVSDLLQRHLNYFPELEAGAEALARNAHLDDADTTFANLAAHLERTHGVSVRVQKTSVMNGALRRYDSDRRVLWLSEILRRGSRNFQSAHAACGARPYRRRPGAHDRRIAGPLPCGPGQLLRERRADAVRRVSERREG